MRTQSFHPFALLAAIFLSALLTFAAEPSKTESSSPTPSAAAVSADQADAMRLEGEKRFHANCGRCHMAPHKFPPRVMATAIRHMRVRATISDEDMRYILYFLTQ